MNARVGWILLIGGLLAFASGVSTTAQEKRPAPPGKWEYKVLTQSELDKAKGLSQLGDEGWELVAVEGELREPLRVNQQAQGLITNHTVRPRTYYLKRSK